MCTNKTRKLITKQIKIFTNIKKVIIFSNYSKYIIAIIHYIQ
jgi:hypothetical protein